MTITLHLEKLRFFAYHGLYELEKRIGNEFELDVLLAFKQEKPLVQHINDTINYAIVFDIIKEEMQQPRELLETFISELALRLKNNFPQICKTNITIYKRTVPIEGITGRVGVALEQQY